MKGEKEINKVFRKKGIRKKKKKTGVNKGRDRVYLFL